MTDLRPWCRRAGGPGGRVGAGCVGLLLLLGGAPGEGEEDVVEGGTPQPDVVETDPGPVEQPEGVGQARRPVRDRHEQRSAAGVDGRGLGADRREELLDLGEAGGVGERELEALAADLPFELVGGALGDDPAVVDDDDLVREQVGLLEVLRREQQRGAAGDELLDDVPHVGAPARVEARGRLVEEEHRRVGHEGTRQVEASTHAAGVGACRPVGGVLEAELRQQPRARSRQLAAPRW